MTSISRTPSFKGCDCSFLGGNSQSGFKLNANWLRILNSHLICTQPGLFMKLHGWYLNIVYHYILYNKGNIYINFNTKSMCVYTCHFCTTSTQEHKTSNHKWSTCSFNPRQIRERNFTSIWACALSCVRFTDWTQRYNNWKIILLFDIHIWTYIRKEWVRHNL